jgi:hypothetical protein
MIASAETLNNTNPLIKDTILSSKYLDLDYLLKHVIDLFGFLADSNILGIVYFLFSVFTIFFIVVIIYSTIRIFEIRKKEHQFLHHEIEEYAHHQKLREQESKTKTIFKNPKWQKVLDYLFSSNENDWKLAIIEADSMLLELLIQLGFKGDTIGDKLKNADRDSFHSLSSAWEVHNTRNKIAHEGSSFELSLHEAKRLIALYENIFQEFGFI